MRRSFPLLLLATLAAAAAGGGLELPPGVSSLPPGVPRIVNPDGSLFDVELGLTTPAFQSEGLRLIIGEANKAALELHLKETLPITSTNLTRSFVNDLGYMLYRKAVGNITTSNYWYGVTRGYKFSKLTIANYDARCFEYRHKYQWPISQIDTNVPYLLATQWLGALSMDVAGLNRDCEVRVAISSFWNGLSELGEKPREQTFVPIYYIWWTPKNPPQQGSGGGASVELLLPTKTLIALSVDDPKYIVRKPVVFTNLAALFPGQATIKTNSPAKLEYITVPGR